MKTNLFDKSGWLTVVLFGVVLIAAVAVAQPAVFGHTSEELKMSIEAFGSPSCQDYATGETTWCTAVCPLPASGFEYTVLSGACQSADGTNWGMFGAVSITSGANAGKVGWACQDLSHQVSNVYDATVYCLKSGTP